MLSGLLSTLAGIAIVRRDDCAHIDCCLSEYRIETVFLESHPNLQQDITNIHHCNPGLPVVVYGDEVGYAQTRNAFLCGAMDVLRIGAVTAEEARQMLERALDPLLRTSDSKTLYQTESVKQIAQRGAYFQQQLADGKPPQFYMNGNRMILLRANVICKHPNASWQQDAAWEWIQEFGVGNSFLFESVGNTLCLGGMVEQNFVNTTSFKRMLHARLERFYNGLKQLDCVCAATSCSSDYLSLSVLHHLDNQVALVFYLEESQTIPDSSNRLNASLPANLYSSFCSAVATRNADVAISCIDSAVEKLRNDMPPPDFARGKLNRFLWEFIAVLGNHGESFVSLNLNETRISDLRDSIVSVIRSALQSETPPQPRSPLSELIDRINANPGLPINVDQAAEETRFSRSHFCRLFRQQTGMSFNAYLTQRRIALACDLLNKTGMRIDEIADSIGIGNTWYFKKIFQKETGLTVEEWLAQKRGVPSPSP